MSLKRKNLNTVASDEEGNGICGNGGKEKNIWLEGGDPAVFERVESKGVTGVTVCKRAK